MSHFAGQQSLFVMLQGEREGHNKVKTQLVASQAENQQLIQQLKNMNVAVHDLMAERDGLKAAKNRDSEKILELQEQLEKVTDGKEALAETILELNDRNEELEIELAASEKELQKQHDKVQKLQNEKMEELGKKQEPTQLHTELGKLYMELQEAKKPQLALMAQLTAKNAEVVHLEAKVQELSDEVIAMDGVLTKENLIQLIRLVEQKNKEMEEKQAARRAEGVDGAGIGAELHKFETI